VSDQNGHSPTEDPRVVALAKFSRIIGLDQIGDDAQRITQRGRDPETARFSMHLRERGEVHLGTVKVLWSPVETAKVLAVSLNVGMEYVKPRDWRSIVLGVVRFAVEVEEIEGESFVDSVREWLADYLEIASLGADRDGAAAQGTPFRADEKIHITAKDFIRYVRRDLSERVELPAVREALCDVGFERKTIMYARGDKRSSKSYYVIDAAALEPQRQVAA